MDTIFNHTSKILIVGTSGSGKSILASKISHILCIKNIELDALHWGPNWTEGSLEAFRFKIRNEVEGCHGYVIHGNYSKVQDLTWPAVETIIWLDYSKWVIMWRVITRTLRRVITRERLWAGNVETLRKSLLDKNSIILWAWNTYDKRKEQYVRLFEDNPYRNKNLIRLTKPREATELLKGIPSF